jgi:hypothetical protein
VWVGWYSFNGGSGLRANGQAISALFVTQIAACTSAFTWCVCSYFDDGYVQITHMASGALAGLAGITPGSGYVSHTAGVPYGIIVGLSSFYGGKVRLLTLPPECPLPWSPKACTSSASRAFVPPCARMLNEYALAHGAPLHTGNHALYNALAYTNYRVTSGMH